MSKTAEEWAKETEVVIECYDGIDGGRANREETRALLKERVESYLHQETRGLLEALENFDTYYHEEITNLEFACQSGIRIDPDQLAHYRERLKVARQALATWKERHP